MRFRSLGSYTLAMIWAAIWAPQNCGSYVLIFSVHLQWSKLIRSGVSYKSCRTVPHCSQKGIMGCKHWNAGA